MTQVERNTQIDKIILGVLKTQSICTKDRYDLTGPKEIAKIYKVHTNVVKASINRLLKAEQIKRVQITPSTSFYHLTNR